MRLEPSTCKSNVLSASCGSRFRTSSQTVAPSKISPPATSATHRSLASTATAAKPPSTSRARPGTMPLKTASRSTGAVGAVVRLPAARLPASSNNKAREAELTTHNDGLKRQLQCSNAAFSAMAILFSHMQLKVSQRRVTSRHLCLIKFNCYAYRIKRALSSLVDMLTSLPP